MMNTANYTYHFQDGFLCIEDLNQGGMSVTNCIEDCIETICVIEGIDPMGTKTLYKDSEEMWDGFDYASGKFIFLSCGTLAEAIKKAKS